MPTKIRLQRHGKKGSPYFHIVVADSRAKRDGKFIERIGSYDPNTDPATIELDSDKALDWLSKGAQPSDTARAILSYRGILYKKHLLRGVSKGALSMEDAEAKYQAWLSEKDQKIAGKAERLKSEAADKASKKLADEMAISEARAKKIIARQSSLAGEAAAAAEADASVAADGTEAGAAEGAEAGLADTSAEAPAATESAPEAKAPDAATTEEASPEAKATEAPTAEASGTEAPSAESPAETPADVPADDPKAAEKTESGEEEAKDSGSESSDEESKKA